MRSKKREKTVHLLPKEEDEKKTKEEEEGERRLISANVGDILSRHNLFPPDRSYSPVSNEKEQEEEREEEEEEEEEEEDIG